jgi:putative transposase
VISNTAACARLWLQLAMGRSRFWAAVREVWPQTREQRDGCHKIANVLDKLPKRLPPRAKRMLRKIMYAQTRSQAEQDLDRFVAEFSPKYDQAAACLAKVRSALLTDFDFPAEHWKHLRTTNPIESVFATVRLRQRITNGLQAHRDGRGALAQARCRTPALARARGH